MNDIGVVGLGTMGKALTLNMLDKKIHVAGYNRTKSVVDEMNKQNYYNFTGFHDLKEFVSSLSCPRKVLLMVKAGDVTKSMIQQLVVYLDKGDIIIDAGNSYYKDTIEMTNFLENYGIYFYGVGVSGGEKGARNGPSIMPSGDEAYYKHIKPLLEPIAAHYKNETCCTFIGPKGSGHYVKMVHNGIEYADMQLIAEVYLTLKANGYNNATISNIFNEWNHTYAKSYLLEISSKILRVQDKKSRCELIDLILDQSSHKGTGKWTSKESIDLGVNATSLISAYMARVTSTMTRERDFLRKKNTKESNINLTKLFNAYYLARCIAYVQGFLLMKKASENYEWNLNYREIASIFRAGCIIQSELLNVLMKVFEEEKSTNLLLTNWFKNMSNEKYKDLKDITIETLMLELPIPIFSSSLIYLNQLANKTVGANLIQAQRDFFGAHTFKRKDAEGDFHYEWE